jgi:hypothetical protein
MCFLFVAASGNSSVTPSVMYPFGAAAGDASYPSLDLTCSTPNIGCVGYVPLKYPFYGVLRNYIGVSNMTFALTYCILPVEIDIELTS